MLTKIRIFSIGDWQIISFRITIQKVINCSLLNSYQHLTSICYLPELFRRHLYNWQILKLLAYSALNANSFILHLQKIDEHGIWKNNFDNRNEWIV